jgi:hypothetical protein
MNDKKIDYVVALVTIIFFLLIVGKSGNLSWGTIISLLVIIGIAFLSPLAGLWLAIPVFVLVWFRHSPALFNYMKKLNEAKATK